MWRGDSWSWRRRALDSTVEKHRATRQSLLPGEAPTSSRQGHLQQYSPLVRRDWDGVKS